MNLDNEELASSQLVSINLSDDKRYLMLTEKKCINLKCIDLLSHDDERVRQAYNISCIFGKYIDHSRRLELVNELKEMLALRFIEVKLNQDGDYIVNVLRNKGQASLIRLMLRYTTPQKVRSLMQSAPFNELKHLLLQRMYCQNSPIHVNSISVTLSRAIHSQFMTLSGKMS